MTGIWHSRLTFKKLTDIQKIILKGRYENYTQALELTELDCLVDRREQLCLKFARGFLINVNTKEMCALNDIRNKEKYHLTFASTDRLKKSAIQHMQRLLNK